MKYFHYFPKIKYDNEIVVDIFKRSKIRDLVINKLGFFYEIHISDGIRPDQFTLNYYDSHDPVWVLFFSNNIIDPFHDWLLNSDQLDDYIKDKFDVVSPLESKISLGTLTQVNVIGNMVSFNALNRFTPIKVRDIIESPDGDLRRVIQVLTPSTFIIDASFNVNLNNVNVNLYSDIHSYYNEDGLEIDYTTWLSLPENERSQLTYYQYEVKENEEKRSISVLDEIYIDQAQAELQVIFE